MINFEKIMSETDYSNLLKDECFIFFIELLSKDFSDYIDFDNKEIISILVNLYEYFQIAPNSKLRILNTKSITPNSTVIQVHSTDIKFITDSIREYLNENYYKTKLIIDPIFTCNRSENQKLISLIKDATSSNKQKESLIHIEINKITQQDEYIIQKDLKHILNSVQTAVNDYIPVIENIKKLKDDFKLKSQKDNKNKSLLTDTSNFIEWMLEDNFIFLGYREYKITDSECKYTSSKDLGIFKIKNGYKNDILALTQDNFKKIKDLKLSPFIIEKTTNRSVIHRRTKMDSVEVNQIISNQDFNYCHQFLGLFTQKAIFEQAKNIPLLKKKLDNLIKSRDIAYGSTIHREIRGIFNIVPKEVLFLITQDELYSLIKVIIRSYREQKVKLFFRKSYSGRSLILVVAMPEQSVTSLNLKNLKKYFIKKLNASGAQYHQARSHPGFWQVYYFFNFVDKNQILSYEIKNLENETNILLKSWEEKLIDFLNIKLDRDQSELYIKNYVYNFPKDYQSHNNAQIALGDMFAFDVFYKTQKEQYRFIQSTDKKSNPCTLLRIYSKDKMGLTNIMPILENLGLKVIDEFSYDIEVYSKEMSLQVFSFTDSYGNYVDNDICNNLLEKALSKIVNKVFENSILNSLILHSVLAHSKVNLIRAYYNYYFQIERVFTRKNVSNILIRHAKIVKLLYNFFEYKFSPDISKSKRLEKINKVSLEIKENIAKVSDISEDRVLKAFYNLIDSTTRTNFFSKNQEDNFLISIKIESNKVLNMPDPKPLYEIYVFSPIMEGIHLRAGMIARGGLRWSDRIDDYRTEVLALMKTQKTKNAVIVPTGSKGGFIINLDKKVDGETLKNQYQLFISGLLDVTDNIVKGKVVHNENIICYDGEDPYLVVAADKGTAHLSDSANEISKKYDFWLGDAFASGGSNGYDHKKEGITAKGAWECVKRHFREIGKDIQNQEFSVIGIGDMSGDVFGNGMLLSEKILLKAAFNHIHIFIDPEPNSKVSYEERKRLFNLSKSTWSDYNKDLISKGGGVFDRKSKSIDLTNEIKKVINTKEDSLSGDDLINCLLKSDVELIWNGGVGTYVKASSETNEQVGDKSNDQVRVNANQLKAKVIGEGGNLGLTQLARIEYAYGGGRINTDAIDNSAGVDMSDHEVNLKILFKHLMDKKIIKSIDDRNKHLLSITGSLNKMILQDNYLQSLAISIDVMRSNINIDRYYDLIKDLQAKAVLDVKSEFMPSSKEINSLKNEGKGLLRPQMAILFGYEKIRMYNKLLDSSIPDLPYCEKYLISYFPDEISSRFRFGIIEHTVRREIISTVLTNYILNNAGVSFFYEINRDTGADYADITGAYIFIDEVFDLISIRNALYNFDLVIDSDFQYSRFRIIEKIIREMLGVNIYFKQYLTPDSKDIDCIKKDIIGFHSDWINSMQESDKIIYQEKMLNLESSNMSHELARKLITFEMLSNIFIYLPLSKEFNKSILECHYIVKSIIDAIEIENVIFLLTKIQPNRMWDQILINHLKIEYKACIYELSRIILKKYKGSIEQFIECKKASIEFFLYLVNHHKQETNFDSLEAFVVMLSFLKKLTY